jgi:DUF4097 and DUF4098 domain-containing protein YvlB
MSAGSRKGALIFGLILIGIGLAFFLSNWFSTLTAWQLLARYWPVLLILVGAKKLYGYFTYPEEPVPADPTAKRPRRCCPSMLAGLIWIGLGVMFLLKNFGIGPDLWAMARSYWPILLILLGLGKVLDYFRQKQGISLRIGEVFGILFITIIGLAFSQIRGSALPDLINSSINIGGTDISLATAHEYTQEYTYPISAGMPVRVENSNGLVTVSAGTEGEVRVHLRKKVFEDDEVRAKQIGDEIKVESGEEGKAEAAVLVVKTNREDLSAKNYHFNTDMEIFVPKRVQLEIKNAFGGVNVSGLDGKLNVQTTHQPLDVHDCSGSFVIANRYGSSRLTNLTGNVTVDARGRVTVETVKGDVDVRNDNSGVSIKDVEGKATITNTDGNITVDHVTKPVTIDARGTRVNVSNLEDSLKITGSYQPIQITDVAGNVVVSSQYARTVSIKKVKGNVDIDSNTDNRITLDDIGGYVKAVAQGSSVRVNKSGGPVEINTTLRDVSVSNAGKGCKVTNDRGDISVSLDSLGKDGINLKNSNGDITLNLPPDAAFQISASARNGHIRSDFPGLEPAEAGDVTTIKGKLKTGGPQIVLETENKDIYVRVRTVEVERRDRN